MCTFDVCFLNMEARKLESAKARKWLLGEYTGSPQRFIGVITSLFLFVCSALAQTYTVTGGGHVPLMAENNTVSRIQVYLVYGMEGVQVSFTSPSTSHQWYRYRTRALDDSEPVASTQNGSTSFITPVAEGYGYYVKENETIGMNNFVWIINYQPNEVFLRNMRLSTQVDECIAVSFDGDAAIPDMNYFTPAGVQTKLNRTFELSFTTLQWDEKQKRFLSLPFTKSFNTHPFSTTFPLHATDPMLLADTEITLKGDLFARHFGVEKTISMSYKAKAIQVYADTALLSVGTGNVSDSDEDLCAPAVFRFNAYANTPVASRFVWKIFNRDEPEKMLIQHNGNELEYTFNRAGTFTARLEVSDRTGTCSNEGEEDHEFRITITETEMTIPNAFSPGATPGINDVFKVRYKSVVRFQGWIFNRWGTELFHWSDPAQGWDGTYRGKYVPAGAYYYVIEYTGTDGKKRTKTGDINVFRGRDGN